MPRSRSFSRASNEAVVVALVEADGRLVKDVEDAAQAGANLGGEADALALAAGERGGAAIEREVVEAYGAEELKALNDLAADAIGHQRLAGGELELVGGLKRAVQAECGEVGDGQAVDLDGERFGAQALAAAGGAGRSRHEVHHVLAIAVAAGFLNGVAQVSQDAVETGARGFALGRPVNQDALVGVGQVFKGFFEVDGVALRGQVDELEQVLRGGAGAEAAIEQGLRPVSDDLGGVEVIHGAEAVALRAGAEGGVEAEAARLQLGDVEAAVGAGHGGGEKLFLAAGKGDEDEAVGHLKGAGDGGFETLFQGGFGGGRSFGESHPWGREAVPKDGAPTVVVDSGVGFSRMRSMMASMAWFLRRSSWKGSDRSCISPSMRARNPCVSS